MKARFQQYFTQIIDGTKKGVIPSLLRGVSVPLGLCYHGITHLRNQAYAHDWLQIDRVSCPVISIGNIVAGGVGKTPLVSKLAAELASYLKVGIVSRGYRLPAEKEEHPLILAKGHGPEYSAHRAGDEAYLLSRAVPSAIVCIGRDRIMGANLAKRLGAQTVILDDGFQHRRLHRDVDIVVLSSKDPFGKGHFLPHGFLRDEISSLSRADCIVLNEQDKTMSEENLLMLNKLTKAPLIVMRQVLKSIRDKTGNDLTLSNKRVGAICGIANPERFFHLLGSNGMQVVESMILPDHMPITAAELERFSSHCRKKQVEYLLCTEKDWVKWPINADPDLPVAWVKINLEITQGQENWDQLIQKILRLKT